MNYNICNLIDGGSEMKGINTDTTSIMLVNAEKIIKRIDEEKTKCKENIREFCIDKAVELLHGYFIYEGKLHGIASNECGIELEILKFLQSIIDK